MTSVQRRLAVLGSPISHSLSPALHAAAYGVLGLDWRYDSAEVKAEGLADFIGGLGDEWRGLSLTMPLKESVQPLLRSIDADARLTGAVNTVLIDESGRSGFNTDVAGIEAAFAERRVDAGSRALIIGGGATARSAIVALQHMGVGSLVAAARRADAAAATAEFARGVGLTAKSQVLGDPWIDEAQASDVIVSTLPGDARAPMPGLRDSSAEFFDVAYSDTGSHVRQWWAASGGRAPSVDGLDMLVRQALLQVRVFMSGDAASPLRNESAVLRAMDAAVGRS